MARGKGNVRVLIGLELGPLGEVILLDQGVQLGLHPKAEVLRYLILVGEVKHANGPARVTVELGYYVSLYLLHRFGVPKVVPTTVDPSL